MSLPAAVPAARPSRPTGASVRALGFRGDDAALVAGLERGHPGAAEAFHDRFARKMHGLLFRLMGPDPELEDVLHDAFVRALEALPKLRDPRALQSWVMGVTVRTARTWIQRRWRRRWLRIVPSEELPEVAAAPRDPAVGEALRATYRVLAGLPVDERIALSLRWAAKMTVSEAAAACGVSESTLKRRVKRGEKAFLEAALAEPSLEDWLNGGGR